MSSIAIKRQRTRMQRIGAFCLYLLPMALALMWHAWMIFNLYYNGGDSLWGLLPLPAFVFCAVAALCALKWRAAISLAAPLAYFYALLTVPQIQWPIELFAQLVDQLRLSSLQGSIDKCQKDAVLVGNEGRLGLCQVRANNDFTSDIIYDSTDEVASSDQHFSTEWQTSAQHLSRDHEAPFGFAGFKAVRIRDHFYRVDFDSDLPPTGFDQSK